VSWSETPLLYRFAAEDPGFVQRFAAVPPLSLDPSPDIGVLFSDFAWKTGATPIVFCGQDTATDRGRGVRTGAPSLAVYYAFIHGAPVQLIEELKISWCQASEGSGATCGKYLVMSVEYQRCSRVKCLRDVSTQDRRQKTGCKWGSSAEMRCKHCSEKVQAGPMSGSAERVLCSECDSGSSYGR
jgi:hypothetical protein